MFILYTKTGCPYCMKVLRYAEEAGISFDERNIADEENVKELLEKGGKRQVPFLVDEVKGISMYESDDIIEYLKNRH